MIRFTKVLAFIMLMIAMMVAVGCKPDENNDSDVRVTTYTPQDITATTAKCGGDVIATQGLSLNELGICWSKERHPSVEDTVASTTNWKNAFIYTLTGLEPSTKYYVRAFALRGLDYYYGEEKNFTTLGGDLPTITTMEVSNITANSAVFEGEIVSDGGVAVTERGFCWSTNTYPTIDDEHSGVGSGSGTFTLNVDGLEQNTTYYVRAFAKNYYGVNYGSQVSFTTQKEELPIVATLDVTNITAHSATCGGEVVSEGGLPVVERGICWSVYPNPTINDAHNSMGSGSGSFTVDMYGLEQNVIYHVRAYAANSVGTGYGEDKTFSTGINTISVTANPPEGGVVWGSGTYELGQNCTVTAQANNDFVFANWREDGSVVSNDANYTFEVNGDRVLVAYFNYIGNGAIHADSPIFVAWATGCTVERGPMRIDQPENGNASYGVESSALGSPGGATDIVSLGDGGIATLTFDSPICNEQGPDFAVFENTLENTAQPGSFFVELGFVEVSSDGLNFFRFPAISNIPTDTQLGPFDCANPQLVHNFAGRDLAMYGTPFDLDDLPNNALLDKSKITHVRIVDAVGSINPQYATYDSEGHIVNDPWPTPFNSSGFDLDAVGVIHDLEHYRKY